MRFLFVVLLLAALCFAQSPGWTAGSHIVDHNDGTYDIGAEALIPKGFGSYDLRFTVPAGLNVTGFQGDVSWAPSCQGDALFVLVVGGRAAGQLILKSTGQPVNQWFAFTQSSPTGDGTARLHVEGNPQCVGSYAGYSSFEIQAALQVQ